MKKARAVRQKASPAASPPSRYGYIPYLILFAAILARFLYVGQLKELPFFTQPVGDEAAYQATAQRILGGDLLAGTKVFYQDPFYPYFLAAVYSLSGVDTLAPKLLQLAGGVLSCLLVFLIARRLFGLAVGTVAGLVSSVYPLFYYFEAQLLKSSLVVLFTLSAFFLLLRHAEKRGHPAVFLSGLLLGLAVVAQGHSYFYVPFALFWLYRLDGAPPPGTRFKAPALFLAGIALVVLPVAVRNYAVSGEPVLTTYQAGTNFYIGNNEQANGIYLPLREGRELPPFEEIDAVELAQREAGRPLNASAVSSFWFGKAFRFIAGHPAAYAALMAKKTFLFFNDLEPPDVIDYYFVRERSFLFRIPFLGFGVVGPLALAGIVLSRREKAPGASLVKFFALASFLSVVLFYVFSRYRLQGMPFFIILASYAAVTLARIARAGEYRRLFFIVPVIAVLLAFSHRDTKLISEGMGHDLVGIMLMEQGEYAQALEYFKVSAAKPNHEASIRYRSHLNMGRCYFELKNYDRALGEYQRAMEMLKLRRDAAPEESAALEMQVALIHQRRKEYGPAREILERLRELRPGMLDARLGLANVYKKLNEHAAAVREFSYVLERDSANVVACNNLANLYRDTGRFALAEEYYRRCLEIDPRNGVVLKNLEHLEALKKFDFKEGMPAPRGGGG